MENKQIQISSYIVMAIILLAAFNLHLMSAIIAGSVVFILVKKLYQKISPKMQSEKAKKLTLFIVVTSVVLLMSGIVLSVAYGIKSNQGGTQNLTDQAFKVLQETKQYLPQSMLSYIPEDVIALKEKALFVLNKQKPEIFAVTTHSLKVVAHSIIGIIIGAVIAFSFLGFKKQEHEMKPFAEALFMRVARFIDVFERVIFAQGKISAINTSLTFVYLIIILPFFNIHIPYAKTLVILTFMVGLIPVLGNLISNSFIILMSLSVSFQASLASLALLVIIHKLEYYINAKIVGSKIKTAIWELLIAMVVMETLFGLIGVAIAPIIYGYIKEELRHAELI